MAGTQNLRPAYLKSKEEHIAISRKGGIKSGETRRRKKEMRDLILDILGKKQFKKKIDGFDDIDSMEELYNKNLTIAEKLVLVQITKALEGDTEAFKTIRDTAGQKPTEKVSVKQESSVHKDLIENLEKRKVEGLDD